MVAIGLAPQKRAMVPTSPIHISYPRLASFTELSPRLRPEYLQREFPPGLVQHFAEGHDVKCAETTGLGNASGAVVQAIAAATAKAEGRGAKVG